MPGEPALPAGPAAGGVLRVTAGTLAAATDIVAWSGRTTLGVLRRLPGVAGPLDDVAAGLAARGDAALQTATGIARVVLRTIVREVVAAALLEVDLTRVVRDYVDLDLIAAGIDVDAIAARVDVAAIVRRLDLDAIVDTVDLERQVRRVDLDAIAASLDVNAVAASLDLDAVIARLDLIGLADTIIEGVDLPQIIRDSTGSLSEEAVRGMRSQGMQADDAVAGFVGKLFGRDRHHPGVPSTDRTAIDEEPGR
ncbi:hypothetical protein [Rhodococcus olei]